MNILIAAIGKIKRGPAQALFDYYTERTPWKIAVKEFELKKQTDTPSRKAKEAELLLSACAGITHIIALDEKGLEWTSAGFATHVRKLRDDGERSVAFIIGGADGLHETVLKRAQITLSLGRVTWPHMMIRGLLAEQLYRAHTIISGHPYHRE